MASYNEPSPKADQYSSHPLHMIPQYPPPPDTDSPSSTPFAQQLYPNTDPALQPSLQPIPLQPAPPQEQPGNTTTKAQKPHDQPEGGESRDIKNRLRKACDSCSIRKVKCDEQSPCKACIALEIPCTFDRPSKRRGPPNRHADAIKKQRAGSPGNATHSQPASPTHAAHTLASFSQQQILSAESIVPWPVLSALIDDYFVFIHPLIPVPHEPSFRQALQRREDVTNSTFLALLASMLGCLVASFPRRPRQHLRSLGYEGYFPNSMSVVDRCNKVAVEAQGSANFYRNVTVHDAIISYLQGLTCAYTFKRDPCLLHFSQCLSYSTLLGLHKSSARGQLLDVSQVPRMTPNGQSLQGPQPHGSGDLVLQELGRRTFWVLFVSVKSLHQFGVPPSVLNIPPATKADPYPPLPLEIDDQYLTPQQVYPQPPATVSEIVGFNINVRIFSSYDQISTNELVHGVDEVFDWQRQKSELEESLQNVKRIMQQLPTELQLNPRSTASNPSSHQYPSPDDLLGPPRYNGTFNPVDISDRASIQHEIQKANIYASQLGTRSYLVEKYWTLSSSSHQTTSAPSSRHSRSQQQQQQEQQLQPSLASTSSSALTEAAMTAERLEIIQDFLRVLSTISQVNMEPNGGSFIQKVRAIASTLLATPDKRRNGSSHGRKTRVLRGLQDAAPDDNNSTTGGGGGAAAADQNSVVAVEEEEYLESFLSILARLENVVPPNETPSAQDEDAQLREWADLRSEQERFARAGGFLATG